MTNAIPRSESAPDDPAPGDHPEHPDVWVAARGYLVGFLLASLLTAVSLYVATGAPVWRPSIPIALSVLAVAQIGVHLVFFLHLTSGPDNLNNALALAFGVLIVGLLVFGSLWIMRALDGNMVPMEGTVQMAH